MGKTVRLHMCSLYPVDLRGRKHNGLQALKVQKVIRESKVLKATRDNKVFRAKKGAKGDPGTAATIACWHSNNWCGWIKRYCK